MKPKKEINNVPKVLKFMANEVREKKEAREGRGFWRGNWQGDTYPRYYKKGYPEEMNIKKKA